jgi:hypothetical protein
MSRLYSVTLHSQTLPVGFNIVSVPAPDDLAMVGSPEGSLEAVGFHIYEPFASESPGDASLRLANLVAFTLWKGRKRDARTIEATYEAHTAEFHGFLKWVVRQDIVPIESSPMHGSSIESLMKAGSLMGFASGSEFYGLMHHDPVICIVALPMTVVIGATVGTGEAVHQRVKYLLGWSKKSPRRRPGKRKHPI